MNILNEEALEAMGSLTGLDQKYCLKLVGRLRDLGLQNHASDAVCALADAPIRPIKR